jgi:hypothetical protein
MDVKFHNIDMSKVADHEVKLAIDVTGLNGVDKIVEHFGNVKKMWENKNFDLIALVGLGADVYKLIKSFKKG